MKSEKEIREGINKTTENFKCVLNCYPATVMINAPRALMQVAAKAKLDTLYEILGEKRPRFKCDDFEKENH